ncbi:MAG: hypothetical protein WBV28_07850, partial [Terracidiphilus sp.]
SGGATSPSMLQLNVPALAMMGYTHDFVAWFHHGNDSRLSPIRPPFSAALQVGFGLRQPNLT